MSESEVVIVENNKQGTIKRLVSEFVLKDGDVSSIIKNALKEKGYDIETKPMQSGPMGFFIGEELKIFKSE